MTEHSLFTWHTWVLLVVPSSYLYDSRPMLFFKTDQTSKDAESKMQFQIRAQMYHNLMVAA